MKDNLYRLLLFITIFGSNLHAQEKAIGDWKMKRCAVVLTYDDGLNVHLDKVAPMLDSLNFKATFYVPGYSASLRSRLIYWKALAHNGHELGNHTLFHPCSGSKYGIRSWVKREFDLDHYSIGRITNEIRAANLLLQSIDGKPKRTFAYTCGQLSVNDSSYVSSIKDDFLAARGTTGGLNHLSDLDPMHIKSYIIDGQSAMELIDLVDKALESNSLIVLLFHGVGGGHPLNISQKEHDHFLRELKNKENDIWIATMLEVAEYIHERKK